MKHEESSGRSHQEEAAALVEATLASMHSDNPDWSQPIAHQVYLSKEQIEQFATNRINGVMLLAVVEQEDYLPEEALGTIYHYLADHDKNRVIVSERAIAQNIRYLASVVGDSTRLDRFEAVAQAFDFEGLGVSIPRDRIVDIDAPNI